MNQSRQPKGVPTGGQFATSTKTEPEAVMLSFAETDEERITEVVERYAHSGLLRQVPRLNHGPNYTTPEILLGRTVDGDRIYGKLRLEHHDRGDYRTVDGEMVDSVWGLAFTHTRITKGGRRGTWAEGGGSSIPQEAIAGDKLTSSEVGELSDMAERWHLNTLNSGTRKQRAQAKAIFDQEMVERGHLVRYHDRCFSEIPDDRGYRWGSAHLVEKPPAEQVERALQLFAKANN